MNKKIFIIAGEPSGDLHGANLIKALRRQEPALSVDAIGGMRMKEAGARIVFDLQELSVVGFWEVIKKFSAIKKIYDAARGHIARERPDCVVFIDYPGFNLRLAKDVHALGIKTVYYILPQVWAWGTSRLATIRKHLDKVLVIFPFEETLCKKHGIDATFVGHPLLEEMHPPADARELCARKGLDMQKPCIAILPGSRKESIRNNLEMMCEAFEVFSGAAKNAAQGVVIKSPYHDESLYTQIIGREKGSMFLLEDPDYAIRSCCAAAISTVGTATLEMAILGKPTVVAYRTNMLNWFIGRSLVKLTHLSLINIVAGKKVVEEFIQAEARVAGIEKELEKIMSDREYYCAMEKELARVKELLGSSGASMRAAGEILKIVSAGR
jgi:lipid-A-disaccharide synthase